MAIRALFRSKTLKISSPIFQILTKPHHLSNSQILLQNSQRNTANFSFNRLFHAGRPSYREKNIRLPKYYYLPCQLVKFKDDEETLSEIIESVVKKLKKKDMILVIQELVSMEVELALKMFKLIQEEPWNHKPDVNMYKNLIISLAESKKMEDAIQVWENMRKDGLCPDSQACAKVIRFFLRNGSRADAMNVYEDMKNSRTYAEIIGVLKGPWTHPRLRNGVTLIRNEVKQDFEEIFPGRHIYDPEDTDHPDDIYYPEEMVFEKE